MPFTGNAVRFNNATPGRWDITSGLPNVFPFTVSFYAYLTTDTGTYQTMFWRGAPGNYWYVGTDSDGNTMDFDPGGNPHDFGDFGVGAWHHIAWVVESLSSVKCYLDGALMFTFPAAETPSGPDQVMLGDYSGAGSPLNGRLAAVKMWNAALNATEIAAEMDYYGPVRTSNLYGWWHDSVVDQSGNGHNWALGYGTAPTVEAGPTLTGYTFGTTGSGGVSFAYALAAAGSESVSATGALGFAFSSQAFGSEIEQGTGALGFSFATSGAGVESLTGNAALSFASSVSAIGEVTSRVGTANLSFSWGLAASGKEKFVGAGNCSFGFEILAGYRAPSSAYEFAGQFDSQIPLSGRYDTSVSLSGKFGADIPFTGEF